MEKIINKGLELRDKLVPGGVGGGPRLAKGGGGGRGALKYNLPSGLKYPVPDAQGNTQKFDRLGRTQGTVKKLPREVEHVPIVKSRAEYSSSYDQPRAGSGNKPGGLAQRDIEGMVERGAETIRQRQAAQQAARHEARQASKTARQLKDEEFERRYNPAKETRDAARGKRAANFGNKSFTKFEQGGPVRSSRDYGK